METVGVEEGSQAETRSQSGLWDFIFVGNTWGNTFTFYKSEKGAFTLRFHPFIISETDKTCKLLYTISCTLILLCR